MSIPWGNSTDTLGGYHLVWPRDATLAALALIAANQTKDAVHVLAGLISTQLPDGHWPQNYYPNGVAFWTGSQLDEAAFPVLLAAKLREIGSADLQGTKEMVRGALAFVAFTGPTSDQDRWEESSGTNPFTIAVAIAALVAGADWLEPPEPDYALSLADDWNERLESFCFVTDPRTPIAERPSRIRARCVRDRAASSRDRSDESSRRRATSAWLLSAGDTDRRQSGSLQRRFREAG